MSDFFILHGEDDALDVRIMGQVLKTIGYEGEYKNFPLGQDLLDYTLHRGQYKGAQNKMPDLIILDIGLPTCDGKEVLSLLRADTLTKGIPIIISSGSCSLRDYHQCIALGCNAYIQKSSDLEGFTKTCELFINGWQRLTQQNFF